MTTCLYSLALAAAVSQPWGTQLYDGRWDAVLASPDGERQLRAFVRKQPSNEALEAHLARAHFIVRPGPHGCRLWNRVAGRQPLGGGVAVTLNLCPGKKPELSVFSLPYF